MNPIERRFCWRCLFFALAPVLALGALGWLLLGRGGPEGAVDAVGRVAGLETANAGLRAEIDAMAEELRVARAAALEANVAGPPNLLAEIQALPAPERSALLSQVEPDPEALAARIARLTPPLRARLFDTLPELPAFAGWFEGADMEARRAWLRRTPGGAALLAGAMTDGASALTEQIELLRARADAAAAARDAAIAERDALARTLPAALAGATPPEQDKQSGAKAGLPRAKLSVMAEPAAAPPTPEQPAALALTARLADMEPDDRAAFFGALMRDASFAAWFERTAFEAREAFAADAPAPLPQALDGVALPYFRAAQTELRRLGLYSGPIDGDWGPASRQAMTTFQIAADIQPADGAFSRRVLQSLREAESPKGAIAAPPVSRIGARSDPAMDPPFPAAGAGPAAEIEGERYVGDLADGLPHGRGEMIWANGNRYTGDFVNGQRTGKGKIILPGLTYEGDFVDGRFTGQGLMVFADGRRYEGGFLDGKAHGEGVYRAPDGAVYSGTWRNGCHRIRRSRASSWAWVGASPSECFGQ